MQKEKAEIRRGLAGDLGLSCYGNPNVPGSARSPLILSSGSFAACAREAIESSARKTSLPNHAPHNLTLRTGFSMGNEPSLAYQRTRTAQVASQRLRS